MEVSRERINRAARAAHARATRVAAACGPAECAAACTHLARELDDAFAAARAGGAPVACAPGCDFCCHLRVGVFAHEAVALIHHVRTRLPPAEAAAAERRVLDNAARIDAMTAAEHYAARIPCAFLVDGRCCAYEARPSACAAHHSLSRERCEHAFKNPQHHGTPRNGRPASLELQALGDALIAATHSALEESRSDAARRELHQCVRDLLGERSTTSSTNTGEPTMRAFDVIMRIVTSLLGVLMILMGCVWAMQGLNVGPAAILQGPMVDNIQWTYYGAILAVVGVLEIIWSNTRRSAV